MDDQQLLKKLEEYKEDLQQLVRHSRRRLLNHIKASTGQSSDQDFIRRLSWTMTERWEADEGFRQKCRSLLGSLQLPMEVGTSRQDAYHHSHLVNATLLVLVMDEQQECYDVRETPFEYTQQSCQQYQGSDEVERLEKLEMLYQTLVEHLPHEEVTVGTCKRSSNVSLQDIYELLTQINTKLDNLSSGEENA